MSKLAFGSGVDSASCSTVPTQESIIADNLAAWEHEEFVAENITTSGKHANGKTSKGRKRKHRQSISPTQSFLLETSEDSINYSAIQSAALLPKVNQLIPGQVESNLKHLLPNSSPNNIILNNNTSIINPTSIKLPQFNKQDEPEKNQISQISFNCSGSGDSSCTSESQLDSTYKNSQNSSLVSSLDSSSNQTVGEVNPPLISSIQPASKKNARKSTLPSLPEEVEKKKLNVPPKEVGKKKPTKAATKTKTKGTQVNLKTKAPKTNVGPKKTTEKKVIRKKRSENKKEKQENSQQIEDTTSENIVLGNDLNINLGDSSNFEPKSKETLIKEKIEEFLNMPSTTHAVPDMNNTIGSVDINMNHTLSSVDLDQTGTETLVSQSCSIEIVKEANRASKINIILPPETNLSFSKKNPANTKSNRNSLPANKVKNDSLSAENDTPKLGKMKIKQEKPSPKSIDLTSAAQPVKMKHKKKDKKDNKSHSKRTETPKCGNKKHGKSSPEPKAKRQTIACGYMSSDSSGESDDSYDRSDYSSSSCSCSSCADYCNCSFCRHSTSCSCSSCTSYSESSYESPVRRRRHR